jgi:hypothetical protein
MKNFLSALSESEIAEISMYAFDEFQNKDFDHNYKFELGKEYEGFKSSIQQFGISYSENKFFADSPSPYEPMNPIALIRYFDAVGLYISISGSKDSWFYEIIDDNGYIVCSEYAGTRAAVTFLAISKAIILRNCQTTPSNKFLESKFVGEEVIIYGLDESVICLNVLELLDEPMKVQTRTYNGIPHFWNFELMKNRKGNAYISCTLTVQDMKVLYNSDFCIVSDKKYEDYDTDYNRFKFHN